MKTKHIYIVTLIEDNGERILFATHNLIYAKNRCEKANKMIEKWQDYFDTQSTFKGLEMDWFEHCNMRNWQWQEARKAVIVKTELR
jgi:hypothetical protein